MESSVKKNPVHYLAHLEYKNKVKKQQDIEYLRKHGHLIKREENFHLFFNGANDDRIKNSKKACLFRYDLFLVSSEFFSYSQMQFYQSRTNSQTRDKKTPKNVCPCLE